MPRIPTAARAAQTSADQVVNNPEHPFVRCNGRWVDSTRTTGEGIGTLIQFQPSSRARNEIQWNPAAGIGRHIAAYSEMWEELNRCANFTPGLNDTQRHSMYVQMACHARWAVSDHPRTGGNTWDLEGWRRDVAWDYGMSFAGMCGRNYGTLSASEAATWLVGDMINGFYDGDPDPRKAWLIQLDGGEPVRRHVTTGSAYSCMAARGHREARWFPNAFVELLREAATLHDAEACPGTAPGPGSSAPAPPGAAPAPTPAPAPTWAEQQGSLGANTFQNPYNASGQGPKVQPYQWVEVTCKVHAPQIKSANPDGYWYRIASAPWSNAYYAVANTFWNGDVPGQKPYTHNTDFAVADC